MSPKIFLGMLSGIILLITAYWLEEGLFDYLTDPVAQVNMGRELGIDRDGEDREAHDTEENEPE